MSTAQLSVVIALREAIFKTTSIYNIVTELEDQSPRIDITGNDADGSYVYIKVTDPEMEISDIAEEVVGVIVSKMDDMDLDWILTSLDVDLASAINTIRDCDPSILFTIDKSLKRNDKDERIFYIEQCSIQT